MRRLGCWACSCGLSLAASVWGSNEAVTMSVAFTPEVDGSPSGESLPVFEDVEGSPLPRPEVNRIGSVPMGKFDVESKFKPGKYFVEGQNVSVGGTLFSFRNLTNQFPFLDPQGHSKTEAFFCKRDDDVVFEANICMPRSTAAEGELKTESSILGTQGASGSIENDQPDPCQVSILVVRASHLLFSDESNVWLPLHRLGKEQPTHLAKLLHAVGEHLKGEGQWPQLIVTVGKTNIVSFPMDLILMPNSKDSHQSGSGQKVELVSEEKLCREYTFFWRHAYLALAESQSTKFIFQDTREYNKAIESILALECREYPSLLKHVAKKQALWDTCYTVAIQNSKENIKFLSEKLNISDDIQEPSEEFKTLFQQFKAMEHDINRLEGEIERRRAKRLPDSERSLEQYEKQLTSLKEHRKQNYDLVYLEQLLAKTKNKQQLDETDNKLQAALWVRLMQEREEQKYCKDNRDRVNNFIKHMRNFLSKVYVVE